ncbi:MAG: GMC family oxidoreductase [Gemmatimonadetes bacterium]|nr:GMC family oxidoreductase [Gemmatimonadota bacterium]
MFHDTRELGDGGRVEADVCVVGAGAAGIAIAHELQGRPLRVAVLTSGGLDFHREAQKLYAGESVGRPAFSPYRSRVRMYGGSTTAWAGQCRPLERLDFERRDWVPHSGWPLSKEELQPYYRRAQRVSQLGPYDYDPDYWASDGCGVLPVDRDTLDVRAYQFSHPVDFGKVYRDELAASRNVDVYLHANVVDIEVEPDARKVSSLQVATLNGQRLQFVAKHYVLACGGLENPRILLASNRVASDGLGNGHDLVGRFYTDHPFHYGGYFDPAHAAFDRTLHVIEDYARVGSQQRAHVALALPEETIRREQLNDCAVYFVRRPSYKIQPAYFRSGMRSLAQLADTVRRQDLPNGSAWEEVRTVARGLPDVSRVFARRLVESVRPRRRLALRTALEATPNPDSRVTLSARRDRFGVPQVRLDWRVNRDDQRGMRRLYEIIRAECARTGIGRLVENREVDDDGWPVSMTSGMHHMGTTRMHDDPRRGVVDAECRVHDMANLYVAGSSVFPTGGVANPTLTIVALAIRLADHLLRVAGEGIRVAGGVTADGEKSFE